MRKPDTLPTLIERVAKRTPHRPAIIAEDGTALSFSGFHQGILTTVAELNALGIGRNDPVAVVLPNGPTMAFAFFAFASGATCAPLNPRYQEAEYSFFLSDLNARALITIPGTSPPAERVAEQLGIPVLAAQPTAPDLPGLFALADVSGRAASLRDEPPQTGIAELDDVALVLHTSGTTSRPKIVPLRHRNLVASAANIRSTLALTEADRCLNVMPLFHIHGLMAALTASLSSGASVVCTGGFNAPTFFDLLRRHEPTWYTAVPTMHQAVLRRAALAGIAEVPSLRFVRSSSSSLPPQVMQSLEALFDAPVVEAYGMTEASHQMTSNPLPPAVRKPGSVGLPAGPEVAIMAEDENLLLERGQTGEIVIRGKNVTDGYANNPDANASAFCDGWFRTGDQGYADADGYVHITGRLKEIINRGGEKISPREIDEALLDHPDVVQALSFAVPDPTLGEDIGAAIVLGDNNTPTGQDIRRFASSRLADFKVPRHIVFLKEIPKGPTGKLQRIGLAEKLGIDASAASATGRSADAHSTETLTATESAVSGIWSDILNLEGFGIDEAFTELGGDSILATRLAMTIRKELLVEFPLVEFFEAPTIRTQAGLIDKWREEAS